LKRHQLFGTIVENGMEFMFIGDDFEVFSITTPEKFQGLVNALNAVAGHSAFCSHLNDNLSDKPGWITFEWNKEHASMQFATLKECEVKNLRKLRKL
jgi:hypothetical protein